MAGVAVLHPQDVFQHQHHSRRSSFISAAVKSTRTRNNPSANNNEINARSSPSKGRKRSQTKKDSSLFKEANHNATTKPKYKSKPNPKPTFTTAPGNTSNINLVMGQVKILKRGEAMPASTPPQVDSPRTPTNNSIKGGGSSHDVSVLSSVDHKVRAEPALLRKQIRFYDCYAGSSCVSSPPPSSLPVPAFFKKKTLALGDSSSSNGGTSDATNDLLKLLRLDLS